MKHGWLEIWSLPVLIANCQSRKGHVLLVGEIGRGQDVVGQVLVDVVHEEGDGVAEQNGKDDEPIRLAKQSIGQF